MSARKSRNGSIFVFPDEYFSEQGNSCSTTSQEFTDLEGRLNMGSRKSEELASRRLLAASWVQEMAGPLHLSAAPSEEEMRLCLRNGLVLCRIINSVHPGAVSKVVESPSSLPTDGALSAYQYFENVRNFLLAAEALELPTFDASDLEETIFVAGSLSKVVDCILALKSYHEWKRKGGVGPWRRGAGAKVHHEKESCPKSVFAFSLDEAGKCSLSNSNATTNSRKRCILPDVGFIGETDLLLPDEPAELAGSEAMCFNHGRKGYRP